MINLQNALNELHPQYLTSHTGEKLLIAFPIKEWETLLELFEDIEDIIDAQQVLDSIAKGEDTVSWESIKAEHGL